MVVILDKNPDVRKNFIINDGNKEIRHNKTLQILGVKVSRNGSWNQHLKEGSTSVKSQIYRKIKDIRTIARYSGRALTTHLATAYVLSSLSYGATVWGTCTAGSCKICTVPPDILLESI